MSHQPGVLVPVAADQLPAVPLTLEGASVLHQMLRIRWKSWKDQPASKRRDQLTGLEAWLGEAETSSDAPSALFQLIGHKGDLLLMHFRHSFEELARVESRLAQLEIAEHLEVTNSYLSVVELGLYESTSKIYAALTAKGIAPHSPEWDKEINEVLQMQRKAMRPRLYPEIPDRKYICFYPMNRRRGEQKNWYTVPMPERQRMMHEHGLVGRRYQGEVKQIISGSIGYEAWEWGVTLFAEDPLVFKRLIYEMRFDEVSAVYAEFGDFFVGVRQKAEQIHKLFGTSAHD